MRKTFIAAGLSTLGIIGLLLLDDPAIAHIGDSSLIAQEQFTVPGPNADAKLASAIDHIADILPAFGDPKVDSNVRLSKSPRWGHFSYETSALIPGFSDIRMDIVLSTVAIQCAPGQPGWNVELDLRKSTPNISDNYNQMNLHICGIQHLANGSISVPVKGLLIEGPKKHWTQSGIVSLQIRRFLPKVAQSLTKLFHDGR